MEFAHPDAEQSVISAVLNATPVGHAIAGNCLHPQDFAAPLYRVIYEAARECLVGARPLDDLSVATEANRVARRHKLPVQVSPLIISSLRQVDWRAADAYSETVKELAWMRRAQAWAARFQETLESYPDVHDAYAELSAGLGELRPDVRNEGRLLRGDDMEGAYAEVYARRLDPKRPAALDFPWRSWRQRILPLEGATLGIFAAAPATGKSTVLMMLAEWWARSVPVVYVDYEMGRTRFLDRQTVRHARVPLDTLRRAEPLPPDNEARMRERFAKFRPRLNYFDGEGLPAERLAVEVGQLVDEGLCSALVVDYVGKIPPSASQVKLYAGQVWERQAADIEMLHQLSVRHNIPVFTAAQITEKAAGARGNGTLELRDIRGTSQYIDKAQVILLASRKRLTEPERDGQGRIVNEAGALSAVIDVVVGKQNDGDGATFQQKIDDFYTIHDVASERIEFNA